MNRVQQRKAQEALTVDKIKKRLERIKLRQERLGNVVESKDHYIGWCCYFLTFPQLLSFAGCECMGESGLQLACMCLYSYLLRKSCTSASEFNTIMMYGGVLQ